MLFEPKPHQTEATVSVVEELRQYDRTNIAMPCATGKTFVGVLVEQALSSNATILLFPSLALIKQTLDFWRTNGRLKGAVCLCVCSDKSVISSDDEVSITEQDLGQQITTSAKDVESYFNNNKSIRKVVFSTYQSAQIVSAGMPLSEVFDLGIFDEAHRTAGDEDALFTFALKDANIRIKKRLFMTATPKHEIKGEETGGYSMDDEAIYGRRAYALPIREAIERGIISDYKVIVSVVTSSDVAAKINGNKEPNSTLVKMVASAIAIEKVVSELGVNKVFTFHNSVLAAKSFAENGSVKSVLATSELFHVSGKMPVKHRAKILQKFAQAPISLTSNARCLTEGVDVPAVDMIALMDSKESTVDIVQAAGRAMRLSPGKTFGYILLPIFIDMEKYKNNINDAIKASGMNTIWEVLSQMTEQESMIAFKKASRTDVREARKRNVDFHIIGSDANVATQIREHIDVYYTSRNKSVFDENFKELVSFKEKYGHCNPSKKDSQHLNKWIQRVRFNQANGALSAYNKSRLDDIGFAWDGREFAWNQQFEAFKLGEETPKWRAFQRACYKEGTLSEDRLKKLTDAGFMFTYDPTLDPKSSVCGSIKGRAKMERVTFDVARQRTIEEKIQREQRDAELILERRKINSQRETTAEDRAIYESIANKINSLWLRG